MHHVHGMRRHRSPSSQATTILSVDGIGAYDHMSRQSMLQALQRVPRARAALPFARLFYGQECGRTAGAVHTLSTNWMVVNRGTR